MNSKKRITYKKKCPNPLFEKWLEELYEKAASREHSNSRFTIKNALNSLKKYPLPFKSGTECAILKGFGPKICTYLNNRLREYKENKDTTNVAAPTESDSDISSQASSPKKRRKTQAKQEVVTSRNKTYKPAYRSGAYAILITLLDNFESGGDKFSITKEIIVKNGQKYAEESFLVPKPDSRYTAWSSMATLLKKGLVNKTKSRFAEFSLTDAGYLLALDIKESYQNVRTVNDVINDNLQSQNVLDIDEYCPSASTSSYTTCSEPIPSQSSQNKDDRGLSELITLNAGEFDIFLLVDKAETSGNRKEDQTEIQLKKYNDLKFDLRHLKVGDFLWIAKSKLNSTELVLPFVIERKRMDDLSKSIQDGRFHEQKFRLMKSGIKNVIYLIENYGSNKHVGVIPVQSLMQAIVNTNVQNGFKIHITNSLADSIRFLAMMTKRLTLEFMGKDLTGCSGDPPKDEFMTLEYFNKAFSKTKTLTVTETFIKILLQIKGMSVEKAIAITNVYKTPKMLMDAYTSCGDEKKAESLLCNLIFGDLNNKVGPKISKTVNQLFSIKDFKF